MNKQQLIDAIAETSTENKAVVGRILEALSETITEALDAGEEVTLHGLGKFKPTFKSPRQGRNPATGAAIEIDGRYVVKFTAAKALKDAIN